MGFFDSVKGLTGSIIGLCTFCGTVGAGALYLADYKKKIDTIDDLQSRISRLELRVSAGGGGSGPQGPKGSDGKPGYKATPDHRASVDFRAPKGIQVCLLRNWQILSAG